MKKPIISACLLIISAFSLHSFGQTLAQNQPKTAGVKTPSVAFFPLSELKEGMKGTARTVFHGSEPEEFQVEILGIVPAYIGPKQDLIVGRISGGAADRTSVFAGMSGSPVYIDGKLVGAISYSFPFSKEPICGITPISQMLSIFEQNQNPKPKTGEPQAVSFAELSAPDWRPNFPENSTANAANFNASALLKTAAGQSFQPIATPLAFSGFSPETLNKFAPQLASAGLMAVSAGGGAAPIAPLKKSDENTLKGGASVSMSLIRGDFSVAAAGTVTMRDGDKIYAFGHPFLSLGTADLPMFESSVVAVVPSVNNSFKLAVPNNLVGTMTQDRATGVYGKLGQSPKMIPLKINLQTSRGQTQNYNVEVAKDDFLTPILLNMAIYNALTANERGLGEATVTVSGEIKLKNQPPVKIERRFSGASASQLASASVAIPVNALMGSRFDDLEISEINLHLNSDDGSRTATLERLALDRTEVKAGETFEIQAFVRTNTGRILAQKIPVTLPAERAFGGVARYRRRRRFAERDGGFKTIRAEKLKRAGQNHQRCKKIRPALRTDFKSDERRGHRRKRNAESAAFDVGNLEQRPHDRRFQTDCHDRFDITRTCARRLHRIGTAGFDD